MCLEALIFEIRLTIKLVTRFLTGLLTAIKRVVVCTLDAQCKAGLSCYGMIVEYMRSEYCNILFTFSASCSRAGSVAREFALTIPVFIQTIICSDICNIASVRRCVIMMLVVHASRSRTARKLPKMMS